jgi:hypothetical protein
VGKPPAGTQEKSTGGRAPDGTYEEAEECTDRLEWAGVFGGAFHLGDETHRFFEL